MGMETCSQPRGRDTHRQRAAGSAPDVCFAAAAAAAAAAEPVPVGVPSARRGRAGTGTGIAVVGWTSRCQQY